MKLIILILALLFACGSQKQPSVTYGSIVNDTDIKIGGLENLPIGAKISFDDFEYTKINDSQYVETQNVAPKPSKTIDKSRTKIIVNSHNKEVDKSKEVNKPKETNKIKTETNENSKNKSTKKNGLPWWFVAGMIIAIAVYLFRKYLNIKPFG